MDRSAKLLLLICLLATSFAGTADDCLADKPKIWERREAVVRVIDLPDTSVFQRGSKTYLDLGYKFKADGTGEWVGYIAAYTHQNLNEIDLGMMMAAANLERMPPPPARPLNYSTYVLAAILALSVFGLIVRLLIAVFQDKAKINRRKNSILGGHLSEDNAASPAEVKAAMERAIAKKQASKKFEKKKAAVCVNEMMAPPVMAQRGLHIEPRPKYKFGRRGW